ncbi:MAG: dihydropteroate synthase [Bacteroidetes bacterium]|nr:dihydropteroate synthase [Bacteroidota bacterium]
MYTLQSRGRLLVLDKPKVMGILNLTPDSFYKQSRAATDQVVEMAGQMLEQGATILDLGGQSSRPGSERICADQEGERVWPATEAVRAAFPDAWLSVDTYHAAVAEQAIRLGADIINDISAGDDDPEMLPLVAREQVPFIAMHKQGKPETMQQNPEYKDVTLEVLSYFREKKIQLESMGIYDWVLDPGFGFGKSLEHNYTLFQNLETFQLFDRPVLVGVSRKGMIQKVLGVDANHALNGTTALHMAALMKKASILRVHDVREATECITLFLKLES